MVSIRNTFYYYFEDIPKLVEDIVVESAEHIIQEFPSVALIEDCLNSMIDFALEHKRAVLHIYNSGNRDIYEQYLWKICDHVIEKYVVTVLDGKKSMNLMSMSFVNILAVCCAEL